MTDLRKAAQQALEALYNMVEDGDRTDKQQAMLAITALHTALEQQQAEPVAHSVIAGALFDFMGWLTTRKERLALSSTDNASPAADAIKDFAKMRGLSLDDARVQDWKDYTTPPAAQPEQEPVISAWSLREVYFDEDGEPSMHRSPPAAPEQEPVAYYHPHKGFYWAKPTHISAPTVVDVPPVPLYVKWIAAQRPWVGLTPEEILDLFDINNVYGSKWIEFARTVEAKLKERNA
jgi:hypothetical protein